MRWERFVRSSLASSIVGFINGGSEAAVPDWRSSKETSSFLVCPQQSDCQPCGPALGMSKLLGLSYLAIFKFENKSDLRTVYRFLDDLRRDPSLGRVGLPRSCPHIIALRHWVSCDSCRSSGSAGGFGGCAEVKRLSTATKDDSSRVLRNGTGYGGEALGRSGWRREKVEGAESLRADGETFTKWLVCVPRGLVLALGVATGKKGLPGRVGTACRFTAQLFW